MSLKRTGFKQRTTPMSRGTSTMQRATKPMAAVGKRAKRMGQGKVPPTADEQDWMDRVAAFGCIVCHLHYGIFREAEIHHIKSGDRRIGHLFTLPLCYPHHRGGAGSAPFISRHPYKKRWVSAYGEELTLLDELRGLLA